MLLNKKSQIEVQFNWIFVLIAGALILGFFFMMAVKQKDSSSITISVKVKDNIASIFEGARVSSGTSTKITTAPIELKFNCDDDGYSTYEVFGLTTQVPADVIFAPINLDGRDIVTWSYSWDLPFKIMNFLYVSNPRTRYVFIGNENDELLKYIKSNFPINEFSNQFASSITEVENLNDDNTRIIFVNTPIEQINPLDIHSMFQSMGNKASILNLRGTRNSGKIGYYEDNRLPGEFIKVKDGSYAGEALLFGAIFSDTKSYYECNVKKALRRFNFVNEIYWLKTEIMRKYYMEKGDAQCASNYASAVSSFNRLNESSYCAIFHQESCSVENLDSVLDALSSELNSIETYNDNTKKFSCDLIY